MLKKIKIFSVIGIIIIKIILWALIFEFFFTCIYLIENKKIFTYPIIKKGSDDSYEFSPLTIFVNKSGKRQEGLYAKHEISLPPKSEKFRIFVVGGSTVADERKIPGDRLADHIKLTLSNSGVNTEVYNFGVPNYISLNEFYLVTSRLIYFKPDLIILYDGVNDAFYGSVIKKEVWKPNISDLVINYKSRMDSNFDMPSAQRFKYFIEGSSYFYYYLFRLWPKKSISNIDDLTPSEFSKFVDNDTKSRILNSPKDYSLKSPRYQFFSKEALYNQDAVNVYISNLKMIAASLNANDIAFLHILQPTALTKKKLYPRERWSIEFNNYHYKNFQAVMVKTLNKFRNESQRISKDLNFKKSHFIDMSNFTDDMDLYLYDDYCHAYKDGPLTKLIGKAIGDYVLNEFIEVNQ